MPTAVEQAYNYRQALLKRDTEAVTRLVEAYQGMYDRLAPRIELFVATMEKQIALGKALSKAQVMKLTQYRELIKEINSEMTRYSVNVRYEIEQLSKLAVQQGIADSRTLARLSAGQFGVTIANFKTLNPAVTEQLLGFLAEGSPLVTKLNSYGENFAKYIGERLLDGVSLGKNPTEIAKLLHRELGMGLTDALRTTRTTQLWAYREASRANYLANQDILQGWVWLSARNDTTCAGCLAEDNGEIRPFTEALDDHYNGACTQIPVVKGLPSPVEGTGKDWFDTQPEATQRAMMGEGKYQAYQEGKFEFSQLSTQHTDEVWGSMRTETSLKDLIGAEDGE